MSDQDYPVQLKNVSYWPDYTTIRVGAYRDVELASRLDISTWQYGFVGFRSVDEAKSWLIKQIDALTPFEVARQGPWVDLELKDLQVHPDLSGGSGGTYVYAQLTGLIYPKETVTETQEEATTP